MSSTDKDKLLNNTSKDTCETTNSESTNSEITNGETTNSELSNLETINLETTNPETTSSETTNPEITNGETTNTETTNSETTNPETTNPETTNKKKNCLKEFIQIISDMINDLLNTFPELEKNLTEDLLAIKNKSDNYEINAEKVYDYCVLIFPERFFDILYQNTEIFNNDSETNVTFLPGIDFKILWNENISDNTKETIWKYLQLILFTIITSLSKHDSFGDTAKLFEAINENEFKAKLEETISQMQEVFDNSNNLNSEDTDTPNMEKFPDPELLHQHVNSMMEGKLGKLAKEIAEETAQDIQIDMKDESSVNDVFKKLFKNPTKLMDLIKNVGTKLDNKMKSGEIKESELLAEASELVKKMKDMPGMSNLQNMFGQMGMQGMGGGKLNVNAMQAHLQRQMGQAQQKERMRAKLEQRQKEKEDVLLKSKGSNHDGVESFVFSTGEAPIKSARQPNTGNKKKNKKK